VYDLQWTLGGSTDQSEIENGHGHASKTKEKRQDYEKKFKISAE